MKKLLTIVSIFTLMVGASLFGHVEQSNAAGTNFTDIPSTHYAKEEIDYLVSQGVISGYADGTFRPVQGVTRGQFAAFVSRALKLQNNIKTFTDVSKSNALYTEIGRAAGAKIIYGYADGTFKPNNPVTRADIAVMLDRALQLKGSYTLTKSVSYADYNLIKGGYADTSVKRMAYYGIMTAYSNNNFAPKLQGTRESTVLAIYNMLKVIEKGQPVDGVQPTPTTPVVNKPHYEMTLAELKQAYGPKEMITRNDQYKEGIKTIDLMAVYFSRFHGDNTAPTPTTYFESRFWANGNSSEYNVFYPEYEVISINGVPFTDTNFYDESAFDPYLAFVLPKSPKEDSQFYIDFHTKKKDFAIYIKGKAIMGQLVEASYVKDGSLMVDLSILAKIPGIKINTNSIEFKETKLNFSLNSDKVQVNGVQKVLTTSVVLKNNRTMIPLRSFVNAMGFESYQIKWANRIEITNFPLEVIEGLRDR